MVVGATWGRLAPHHCAFLPGKLVLERFFQWLEGLRAMARALMFQGTGSDVGKTILVAGLCRAARHRGLSVLPFKPQNMSNNAAVARAPNGWGEIGRGQWLQALACGVEPDVDMNPVLLKPQSQIGSQVIKHGRVWKTVKAREYVGLKPELLACVMESFERLSTKADLVLVEGAGSPAEINLRAGDIANMGFAVPADVPVVLIGDIDRGGVIASIVGTHTILDDADRKQVVGYLINRFRGDISLFDEGLDQITGFTQWPSFGVLPWLDCISKLPAEDSVALDRLARTSGAGFHIVVPAMGKIANFDDLDPLKAEAGIRLTFVRKGEAFPGDADLIVIPGSKSTIADMIELRENGWEEPIKSFAGRGGVVIGICGGYQILGKQIHDPQGIEGDIKHIDGLGLLDVETELIPEKIVRDSFPRSVEYDCPLEGYEIHMGRTSGPDCSRAMVRFDDHDDGAISAGGNVRGCYLHGLFGSDQYRRQFLNAAGLQTDASLSYRAGVDEALDELAGAIEHHLDVDGLLAAAR